MLMTATTRTMRLEYLAGLDRFISSPHQAFCFDSVSDWLHGKYQDQLFEIAKTVEDELKLPQRFMKLEISDIAKIIADKTSDNGQERTFRCSFNLKSLKYDNKEIYYLVIADADGLVVSREEFQIDIAFAVDEFDFFS